MLPPPPSRTHQTRRLRDRPHRSPAPRTAESIKRTENENGYVGGPPDHSLVESSAGVLPSVIPLATGASAAAKMGGRSGMGASSVGDA